MAAAGVGSTEVVVVAGRGSVGNGDSDVRDRDE